MYREEARHRGETISEREIAESILENNLHGIDIDPRAVQIAAAAVVLKAKRLAPDARPKRVNLVAPVLRLGGAEGGRPGAGAAPAGAEGRGGDPGGADREAREGAGRAWTTSARCSRWTRPSTTRSASRTIGRKAPLHRATCSPAGFPGGQHRAGDRLGEARATLLDRLEGFLARHTAEEDLGLRLDGEQLAAGVRFVRMVKEGTYDLVVGNPPYQGTSRMVDAKYVASKLSARQRRTSTPRSWSARWSWCGLGASPRCSRCGAGCSWGSSTRSERMLLRTFDLRLIGDVDRGAFEDVPDEVLATAMCVVRKVLPSELRALALQPTPLDDRSRDAARTKRKRAALLAQVGRCEFEYAGVRGDRRRADRLLVDRRIPARRYAAAPKLGDAAPVRNGLSTQDNARFLRRPWEVRRADTEVRELGARPGFGLASWAPYIKGAAGREWFETSCRCAALARFRARVEGLRSSSTGRSYPAVHQKRGALLQAWDRVCHDRRKLPRARPPVPPAYSGTWAPRYFRTTYRQRLCLMNTSLSRFGAQSLNPGVHFQVSDVNRLPMFRVPRAASRSTVTLDEAFSRARGCPRSVCRVQAPGPSPWAVRPGMGTARRRSRRGRAASAVSTQMRSARSGRPTSPSRLASPSAASARTARASSTRPLPLRSRPASSSSPARPSTTRSTHAACAPLHARLGGARRSRRRRRRPPNVAPHRLLQAPQGPLREPPHLLPALLREEELRRLGQHPPLDVEHADDAPRRPPRPRAAPPRGRARGPPEGARQAGEGRARRSAERRFADVQKLLAELTEFIDRVTECAERGPPPTSPDEPKREQDARYEMDLDDGVMVNSAALWPLLEPQWKDPKKWWKELATAKGRKDYDWAHLAKRYFPDARRGEVRRGPVARRRPRLLLAAPPREGVRVGAAAPGRDPARLHHRRGGLGRRARQVPRRPSRRGPRDPAQGG